jgi:hypothetical protein
MTYPGKANDDPEWKEKNVSHDEAQHPDHSQSPADKFVMSVGSRQ